VCGCDRQYKVSAYDCSNREVINERFNDKEAAYKRANALFDPQGARYSYVNVYEIKVVECETFIPQNEWCSVAPITNKETTL
jgi:hypothetical protein